MIKKEINKIVPKDLRLKPNELTTELVEYFLQFIPENEKDEVKKLIEEDCYSYTIKCFLNFRQK